MAPAWVNALVFTSLWVAAAAGLLCVAASLAMGLDPPWLAVSLAVSGTLVIYNVDRLRDLDRDRLTAPARSAFIREHEAGIRALTLIAALAAAGVALASGPRVLPWLVPTCVVGMLHRRLKPLPFAKPVYVTLAWIAVVVGLPLSVSAGGVNAEWVASVLALSILANVIASNVRDQETAAAVTPRLALRLARVFAAFGVAAALAAPDTVRPLVAVPLATLLSLCRSELDEWYGLVVVDGALVLGALVALALY